jgi:hypothetical protein
MTERTPRPKSANARTRQVFARLITTEWRKAVESILATGRLLNEAKDELDHGEFYKMFANKEVPFSQRTAQMLMAIAEHPILSNANHGSHLPPHWRTLSELTKIPNALFEQMLSDGRIHCELERKDVEALLANLKPAAPRGLTDQLIGHLKTIEPAVAESFWNIPLTHYWFTGQQLMAFNDQIAISVPFQTDFKGAVPAKMLRLLQPGFDGEINMRSADRTLAIQDASRVRIGLSMLEPTFPLEMPKSPRLHSDARAIAQLVDGIQHCLPSIGPEDTSAAEYLGVTLEPGDGRIAMFATNNGQSIRQAEIMHAGMIRLQKRVILPKAFCAQLVRLYAGLSEQEKTTVSFVVGRHPRRREQYAMFQAGDTKLYGRLLETRSPLDFAQTVDDHLPRDMALVDVPARFFRAVERAAVIVCDEAGLAKLTVRNGRLTFFSQSKTNKSRKSSRSPVRHVAISVKEVIPIDESHAAISVLVEPVRLWEAAGFDQMQITATCVVFGQASHPERRLLISCHEEDY